MREGFGQQIVIENRLVAASSLCTELAARATPDGYTPLKGRAGFAINPSLLRFLQSGNGCIARIIDALTRNAFGFGAVALAYRLEEFLPMPHRLSAAQRRG